jgi:CRP-like cAMP-binding protein
VGDLGLAGFALFEELDDGDQQALLAYLEERSYEEGRAVFRSGQEAEELLLLLDGEARVQCKGVPLGSLGPGDMIGGLSLLVVGRRRCDVIACSPVRALALERTSYLRLRTEAPGLALAIQEAILRTFARAVASTELADPSAARLVAVDGSGAGD